MKILCTGSSGMLGREVYTAAVNASHQTLGLGRTELDITNRRSIRAELESTRPDVVINCAGLTKHRTPEPTKTEYWLANAQAPHTLAAECDRIGARLIHVSTDCVFDGSRPIEDGPYTEADTATAIDPYGHSKRAGEVTRAPHLTVRCSFVGIGDRGLIAWLRTRGAKTTHTAGIGYTPLWTRVRWSGSTAPAIARALVELAQQPDVTGLMHLAGECVTKSHLIHEIWRVGLAPKSSMEPVTEPVINRWLRSNRSDVPALPPLHEALRELANG